MLFSMRYAIILSQKNKRRSSGVCPLSDTRHDRVLGDKGIAVKVRGNSHYRNSRFDESSRNAYRPAMPIKVSRASGEVVHSGTAGIRLFHSTPRRVLLFYPFVMVTAEDILDAFSAAIFLIRKAKNAHEYIQYSLRFSTLSDGKLSR